MRLIIGLVVTFLLCIILSKQIKKHPVEFYIGTYFIVMMTIIWYNLGYYKDAPSWVTYYITDVVQRGLLSTAIFMVVMFLGVVTKHNSITKKLYAIRAELSIIGCIVAISHNVIFGLIYFNMFFTKPEIMSPQVMIATIITLVLIAIMIPLFITSFKVVRKKMNPRSWKNLQRLAYPFFILMYVHIMILYSVNYRNYILDICIYTFIYLAYIILRVRKAVITSAKRRLTSVN